jgi:hypothetical protein
LIVHCCHCRSCQRQTGSAFVVNALIERDEVALLEGEPTMVEAPRDGGATQRIFRCPTCQIALWSEYTTRRVRFVRVGTLDAPDALTPDVHIYTRSRMPWVVLPPDARAFEAYYDMDQVWLRESLERVAAIRSEG